MVFLLQMGGLVVVQFIARSDITELINYTKVWTIL